MIPLPASVGAHYEDRNVANPSLFRDRGARYVEPEKPDQPRVDHDPAFLKRFVERFSAARQSAEGFHALRKRREETLKSAHHFTLKTRSRLVIGMSLPQSGKENSALLLDRLTGSPFLPGSSVKGLARQAAAEVAVCALEGDSAFWAAKRLRIFGSQQSEGTVIFYDAFPSQWPSLELDILTPHYKKYYENPKEIPGDWEDPVPVPFVTVAAGATFDLYFRALDPDPTQRSEDERQVEDLLRTALDWIGIGGKKSAGYGSFDPGARRPAPAKTVVWEEAEITWIPNRQKLQVAHNGKRAEAAWQGLIAEREKDRIKSARKTVRANVEVRPLGNSFEVVRITFASPTR